MAKCTVQMPDEFIDKMNRLGNRTDEIMEHVLEAGGEVVEAKVKSNLASAIGRNTKYPSRSTGKLLLAVGTSPIRVNKNGDYDVKIGFANSRGGSASNAMIAAILEYGKHGQPPKPFMKPAKSSSKAVAITAMTQKLDQELSEL